MLYLVYLDEKIYYYNFVQFNVNLRIIQSKICR